MFRRYKSRIPKCILKVITAQNKYTQYLLKLKAKTVEDLENRMELKSRGSLARLPLFKMRYMTSEGHFFK